MRGIIPRMMLAPTPRLSGQIVALQDGMRGIEQTLGTMRQLVNQYRTDLTIRQTATATIFLTPEKDQLAEACALFELVRDGIRYTRDVHGVETISTPVITLQGRLGDCDDQVVLLASLLESVGYPTRFVVAGYNYPGELEHVYLQALLDGCWVDMDPTEQHPMGWAAPRPVAYAIERV
jgi:transglutaminase-like putative cysteine protease